MQAATRTGADMDDEDFGTRQPSLTEFIKSLLKRYTDGGQILKVRA